MKTREEVMRASLDGKIAWDEALELIKTLPVPWISPQWRERRDKMLAKECSACSHSSADGAILVITQSRQPHSWSEHVQHQRSIFFERWKADNPFTPAATVADFTYAFEIRPLCPKCNGASQRWKNQKTGIKKCTSVKNKVTCGHEFHHSLTVEGSWSARTYDEQLKTFLSSKNWEAERAWNDIFWAELGDAVRKEAAASSFRESLRYLEMHAEDVTTLCKSCAGKKNRKYIAINNAKGQAMPT